MKNLELKPGNLFFIEDFEYYKKERQYFLIISQVKDENIYKVFINGKISFLYLSDQANFLKFLC